MTQMNPIYHTPVLLKESVEGLQIQPDGIYVDVTFGGGGHSREILTHLSAKGRLLSFDQDADAEKNILNDTKFTFVRSNFRYLRNFLRYYEALPVDGILADLGVSSHHLDEGSRGFSLRSPEAKPDMRMNQRSEFSALQVINEYPKEKLMTVLKMYGELKGVGRLADRIIQAREVEPFRQIDQLINAVAPCFSRDRERKELAKLFQALRIEVNQEMVALQEMLEASIKCLKPGGRLVVITYHSLEDRLVKNFMKSGNCAGEVEKDFFGRINCPLKMAKPDFLIPNEEEIERNPRSRSAKLRIATKL